MIPASSSLHPRGFSLLEVLIALAILGAAITAIVGFQGRGIVMNAKARDLSTATYLARSKMEELKLQINTESMKGKFPDEKSEEGAFPAPLDRYTWKSEIKKVTIPVPSAEGGEQDLLTSLMGMLSKEFEGTVRELRVSISWRELEKERNMSVVTHVIKN